MSDQIYKFDTAVGPGGKVEVTLPISPGTHVEVVVRAAEADDFAGYLKAAASSMDFWNNPWDDEDWNNA